MPESTRPPVALTIAGSDSGGGAGIQADLKTFHAFGVFGTTAVTAVTAQNTLGVREVHLVPPGLVEAQIRAVSEDLRPSSCKSGMLADARIIEAVARAVQEAEIPTFVLDPVMVATSGDRLLAESAIEALRTVLVPLATLVTPNLPRPPSMRTAVAASCSCSAGSPNGLRRSPFRKRTWRSCAVSMPIRWTRFSPKGSASSPICTPYRRCRA